MTTATELQVLAAADERLRQLLKQAAVPATPPSLDHRVECSYREEMIRLQVESNIDLRTKVALSLVAVFAFTVLLSALVIVLIGFELIALRPEIVHILLGSTVAQAVILYRRVIYDLFTGSGHPLPFSDVSEKQRRKNRKADV